ncbi:unnamed protein product [Notodromas monacha]|uniref:Tr-type G domain-containing protein n=1 Tax=Notodromas monacha TaxID=399045 RepID=A0A7R9GBE7_9CRUS|nr:unnamed protein product [Notodromas monacha]CAG0914993.1 unnamed protein product [Notodromas monacha]
MDILAVFSQGNVKTYQDCQTAEEIVEKSAKLITFIDLAGHYKYLHTTIFGLTGYCPHYIMLVVSANTGMAGTTVDHLNLALALNAPFFVVMTKIDVTPGHIMEQTVRTLREFLKAETRRDGLLVETVDDVSRAVKGVKEKGNVVPIFKLSSVTGFGLGLLKEFLHILPPYLNTLEREQLEKVPDDCTSIELRIAVLGNADVGKSTLLGVLTQGDLDNGRGRARLIMFRHLHEVQTGRTSSISHGIMGFDCEREFLKAETRRDGLLVETVDDVSRAVKGVKEKGNVVPIFKLSSVTGLGLGLLKEFLHILPPYLNTLEREQLEKERVQFQIDESWNIPEVGAVVGGLLTKGVITENMRLKLGPVGRGEFMPIIVKTIHRNKANCCVVRASQSASLSLCPINDSPANRLPRLRKGMVLLDPCQESRVAKHFMAKLTLSGCQQQQPQQNQSGAEDGYPVFLLRKGGHATLHIGNVRQGAAVRGVFGARNLEPRNDAWIVSCHPDDEPVSVMFEFLRGPEYLEQGARVLFRVAGETRGQGFVSHIYYSDSSSSTSSLTSGSSSSCDEPFLESE